MFGDSDGIFGSSRGWRNFVPFGSRCRRTRREDRARRGPVFRSEPLEARHLLDSTVVFSELMYHPRESETQEWLELRNLMSVDMDLSRWSIDGIGYEFPAGTIIAAGEHRVVAKDPLQLAAATGLANILGPYTGQLSNGGETLRLRNNSQRVMDELDYDDSGDWTVGADGSGASLAKIRVNGGTEAADNWTSSRMVGGTPGRSNAEVESPVDSVLQFSELSAGGADGFWVELQNGSSSPVDLRDFRLATDDPRVAAHRMAAQELPAGGYRLVRATELGFTPVAGQALFLYAPDGSLADAVRVPDTARARSSDGTGRWWTPVAMTPGTANQFQLESDIVINEVMYHAAGIPAVPQQPAEFEVMPLIKLDALTPWRYRDSSAGLSSDWALAYHPTGSDGWKSGNGLIGFDRDALFEPIRTALPNPASVFPAVRTYYFEREFTVDPASDLSTVDLLLHHVVDDGAIFYLNGLEVLRYNMPEGLVDANTLAASTVNNAERSAVVRLPKDPLKQGSNRLSVEVHQDSVASADVVFGVELSLGRQTRPAIASQPYRESDEEWIELYNRSTTRTIDLTNWMLDDAVDYRFPAGATLGPGQYAVVANDPVAFAARYPEVRSVFGPFNGRLSNDSERIQLLDNAGNPADEVLYHSDGRWSSYADGGGASLELRDTLADNRIPESWAASASMAPAWHTVAYRGVVKPEGFTNGVNSKYQEFILGLLDAGEVMIDDVSVIEDPAGVAAQRIQNGAFQADVPGQAAAKWRGGGTQRALVAVDPFDPANQVLHLVATGPTEDRFNHLETTFAGGAKIREGVEYEIRYRVLWLAGSNQLRSNLYWNRLPHTEVLQRPLRAGTPGARNSRVERNLGPTFHELLHEPAVPAIDQPVTVSVRADDPQGVSGATLHYSVQDGELQTVPMTLGPEGRYQATIPGQAASQIVRFFVTGSDGLGTEASFPPEGPAARALYKVQDSKASTRGLHNFRIILTPADTKALHAPVNQLSNGLTRGTVIYDEKEIFYNVGVRLRGSNAGRGDAQYLGFHVQFDPMQRFRGVHDSVSIDRSGRSSSTPFTQDEILIKHIGNQAGNMPLMYDDLVHVVAPNPAHSRTALLLMARYGDEFLDTQYEKGSDGSTFRLDIAYVPSGTVGNNPEGLKLPNPYLHPQPAMDLQDLGDDKELYRPHLQIGNNRAADDFERIIELSRAFSKTGGALVESVRPMIDLDVWARVFALQSLTGAADTYTRGGLHHNIEFYVRPEDQRVLAMPWDWDFAFTAATNQPLIGTDSNTGRFLNQPGVRRVVYGHLLDMIQTTFNNEYMDRWVDHYGKVAGQNYAPIKTYIKNRKANVLSRMPPVYPFEITSNDGNDFHVDDRQFALRGKAWVDVARIRLKGTNAEVPVRWLDDQYWEATVSLQPGTNVVQLEAVDLRGNVVGGDQILVTSQRTNPVADSLRITEINYHPQSPTAAELAAQGRLEDRDFEFVELANLGDAPINLANVRLTGGVDALLAPQTLQPGEYAVVARKAAAFRLRYGSAARVVGEFYPSSLDDAGESLRMLTAEGRTIADFAYGTESPWPSMADGQGRSLELPQPASTQPIDYGRGEVWRASLEMGGSPGVAPSATPPLAGDFNGDSRVDLVDIDLLCAAIRAQDTRLDLNGDRKTDELDMDYMIEEILQTSVGDVNLDGLFNSSDLVQIFQRGVYEDAVLGNATYGDGDWNCDGDFTSSDLVLAMQAGAYESPRKRRNA